MSQQFTITFDKSNFNIKEIHAFLTDTYWAKGIPIEIVQTSIENSLCIGIMEGEKQIAFARMVTDKATFAYLADVFVIPEHRGKGLSKLMMEKLLELKELQGLRRIMLATKDAEGLYLKFGFNKLVSPDRFMEIRNPNPYNV